MSKNYKIKHEKNEIEIEESNESLSKKELYDLKQKEKIAKKEKLEKKKLKKKKSKKKTYQTNLVGRIFAIVMLILMIGSVIASVATYFMGGY